MKVCREIHELNDASMTLLEWRKVIERLLERYPDDAILSVDAGYNNVNFDLYFEREEHENDGA